MADKGAQDLARLERSGVISGPAGDWADGYGIGESGGAEKSR